MPEPAAMQRWRPGHRRVGAEAAGGRGDLDGLPRPDLVDEPGREHAAGDLADPDARRAAGGRADRVGAPVLDAVDDAAQRQRLPRLEVEQLAQVVGHVEGDGGGVVGQRLDVAHGQLGGRSAGTGRHPQISFTWSNGSRQSVQRYSALQAVEPNSETSSVAGESHCGQRTWPRGRLRGSAGSGRPSRAPDRAGRCRPRTSAARPSRGDPVGRPGRVEAHAHLDPVEAGAVAARAPGRRASSPSPDSRSRSA